MRRNGPKVHQVKVEGSIPGAVVWTFDSYLFSID